MEKTDRMQQRVVQVFGCVEGVGGAWRVRKRGWVGFEERSEDRLKTITMSQSDNHILSSRILKIFLALNQSGQDHKC